MSAALRKVNVLAVRNVLELHLPNLLLSPESSPLNFVVIYDRFPGTAIALRDLQVVPEVEMLVFWVPTEEMPTELEVMALSSQGTGFYVRHLKQVRTFAEMLEGDQGEGAVRRGYRSIKTLR